MSTLPNGEDPNEMPQNAKHINTYASTKNHVNTYILKTNYMFFFLCKVFSSIMLHCVFPLMETSFQCSKKVNFLLKNPQEVFLKL